MAQHYRERAAAVRLLKLGVGTESAQQRLEAVACFYDRMADRIERRAG